MGLKPGLKKILEWLDALKAGKQVDMENVVLSPIQEDFYSDLVKQSSDFFVPEYVVTPDDVKHYYFSRYLGDGLDSEVITELLQTVTEGKNAFYKRGNLPYEHNLAVLSNPKSVTAALQPIDGMASLYQINPVETKKLLRKLRRQEAEELGVRHVPSNLTIEDNPNSLFSLRARHSADSSSLEKKIAEIDASVKKNQKNILPPLALGTGAIGAGLLGAPSGAEANNEVNMGSIGLEKILKALLETPANKSFPIGTIEKGTLKELNALNPAFIAPDVRTTTHARDSRFVKDNWQTEETARSLVEFLDSGELLRGIPNKSGGIRTASEALWLPGDPVSLFAPVVPLRNGGVEVRTIHEDSFKELLEMLKKQDDRWGGGDFPISSLHRNASYGGTSLQRPRLSAVNNQPVVGTNLAEIFEKVKNSKKSVLPPLALGTGT